MPWHNRLRFAFVLCCSIPAELPWYIAQLIEISLINLDC